MAVCIIQARMGSKRLTGKVLMEFCGKPLLGHIVERVRKSRFIDKIVIATTDKTEDNKIEKLAKDMKVDVFRGDDNDVLDRFYKGAKKFNADTVVRVTGDCPLVDPLIVDRTIEYFTENNFDYVSNAYPVPTYPDGLDVEVFSFKALEVAWNKASRQSEREHVTAYIWKNENKDFSLGSVKFTADLSQKRWTVDKPEDAEFVKKIYEALYFKKPFFNTDDVLKLLKEKPKHEKINQGIARNEGYSESLKKDI